MNDIFLLAGTDDENKERHHGKDGDHDQRWITDRQTGRESAGTRQKNIMVCALDSCSVAAVGIGTNVDTTRPSYEYYIDQPLDCLIAPRRVEIIPALTRVVHIQFKCFPRWTEVVSLSLRTDGRLRDAHQRNSGDLRWSEN